jgi:hypothetical protein
VFTFEQRSTLNRDMVGGASTMERSDYADLSAEHGRLRRIYAAAVDRLFALGYRVPDAEYQRLKNEVEQARVKAEIVGLKLTVGAPR